MSLVDKYPKIQEIKSSITKAMQIVKVEEFGRMKRVRMEPKAAREIKNTAINTVTYIAILP